MTDKVVLDWSTDYPDFPSLQHAYHKDEDPYSPDFGYCTHCGMELYAADMNSTHVHSNTGLPERMAINLDDWYDWRNANMPGGE